MSRAAITDNDLCVYVAEAGDNGVGPEIVQLITRCVQDKMFGGSGDTLCVSRDDELGAFEFVGLSWNLLRKVESTFQNPRRADTKVDPIATIFTILEAVQVQAEEDAYGKKKILYFTDLKSELDSGKIKKLVKCVDDSEVYLNIIFPAKGSLSSIQKENVDLLEHVFRHLNKVFISSLPEITRVLENTLSKKPKKSMAWNIDLQIGPDLSIGVQAYIQSRKNTKTELKTALLKNVAGLSGRSVPAVEDRNDDAGPSTSARDPDDDHLVLASKGIEKETIWTQEDGTVVDKDHVIPAYYYGDRLVPFDNAEQEAQYKSGEKCFQVLVFTERKNILPCFMLGDGTDIIIPNPKDPGSDLKLDALVKALYKLKRVAIVRKVRTTNAKLSIGVLAPDISKRCLIYTPLCFADDISIPHFAPLLKEEELGGSLVEGSGLTEKDALMDELILSMPIDDLDLTRGPVDPAVQVVRDSISRKMLGKSVEETKDTCQKDNIDIYFEGLVGTNEEITKRITSAFPLKEVIIKSIERPSGAQIFLKREAPAIESGDGQEEKKIKLETKPEEETGMTYDPDLISPDGRFLYAFDFDHTVIGDNSDTAIITVLHNPLPQDIVSFVHDANWTQYMEKILRHIASQGIPVSALVNRLHELSFAPGMESLLHRIGTKTESHLLILSDANTFFISRILEKSVPPIVPKEVVSNPATPDEDGSLLRLQPYENQHLCPFCPPNLCKGSALEKYVQKEGPFQSVYYTGDGHNDLCPGLRLKESDILFVRKGFGLEKILQKGQHRGNSFQPIKARVVIYEHGHEIEQIMNFE